jgi:hypothetical protein
MAKAGKIYPTRFLVPNFYQNETDSIRG